METLAFSFVVFTASFFAFALLSLLTGVLYYTLKVLQEEYKLRTTICKPIKPINKGA